MTHALSGGVRGAARENVTTPQAAHRSTGPIDDPSALASWLRGLLASDAQLHADSRQVQPGDAFLACAGHEGDARAFIGSAIAAGASALLWDADGLDSEQSRAIESLATEGALAARAVKGLRRNLGALASAFYGDPSHALELVAVTGTNGKTSCTHWLAQGWGVDDDVAAVIGTLGSGRLSELQTFGLTTPDVVSLHRMLAGFRKQGVRSVAIEASSIGLHQGRLDGARIAAAVFTNLSHDHLDYHGSLQAYGQAKALLFARPDLRAAVVNLDDPASGQMLRALESGPSAAAQRVGYSIGEEAAVKPARLDARLFLSSLEARTDGMELALAGDFGKARVRLPLIGRFNASNAIAVAATWLALGMPLSQVVRRLESLSAVRGRLQRVSTGVQADREPLVLVDYAHTPDALTQVLGALRGQTQARAGRLWCVFGAGGDRDRAKRPLMAQAVAAHADRIVVTSDNPRSEQPEAIISQILAGLPRPADAVEPDRARAIAWAIDQADPADVILLAGKGHETWQEMANARLPFDDAAQALQALQHRREVAHD